MGTLLGLTLQSVVAWESYEQNKISGYFAESWEQPDKKTFVFKVRPNLFWHNKPPVNGRAANAEDIVHHIERNKNGKLKDGSEDKNFYRQPEFQIVDKVEAVDNMTVRVTLNTESPFFLNTLAGTWTKVQAPEAVDQFEADFAKFDVGQIIGTGDFQLTTFKAEGELSFRRHEKAWRNPWLDGIDYVPLFTDAAALQAAFEQKQIDAFAPTQIAVFDDISKRLQGQVYSKKIFTANPVLGTFYAGAPPWQDLRLPGAIQQIMDRRGLIQQLLQGRGAISSNVPPAWAPYALPENELVKYPGFLVDRQKDLTEAKAMWDAGGGPALGDILIDIPDIFEGSYAGVSSLITNHLKSVLGNNFTAKLEPYATITSKLVSQQYGNGKANTWWGWGTPPSDPDPSKGLVNAYHSKSSQYPQWSVPITGMDALLDKLAVEFDAEKRVTMNHDVVKLLLQNAGGGIPHIFEGISDILYWNYYHIGESTHQITVQNFARDNWFDQKDATWNGRPS
jgi:peptide/nickel transport system substrate-binding protein